MSSMRDYKQVIASIIFAAGNPIAQSYILEKLPELSLAELKEIIASLKETYSGDNGILLLEFNSNEKYGDIVTEVLTELREKDLTSKVLEVLGVIAYRQPITKAEIDEIRGGADSDYAVSTLVKFNLIEISGRKDAVGRPYLYSTTDNFLKKFNLNKIEDLPDYEEVLEKTFAIYNPISEELFVEKTMKEDIVENTEEQESETKTSKKVEIKDDMEITADELPEFLNDGDNIGIYK